MILKGSKKGVVILLDAVAMTIHKLSVLCSFSMNFGCNYSLQDTEMILRFPPNTFENTILQIVSALARTFLALVFVLGIWC
jgi:hypothetical protein